MLDLPAKMLSQFDQLSGKQFFVFSVQKKPETTSLERQEKEALFSEWLTKNPSISISSCTIGSFCGNWRRTGADGRVEQMEARMIRVLGQGLSAYAVEMEFLKNGDSVGSMAIKQRDSSHFTSCLLSMSQKAFKNSFLEMCILDEGNGASGHIPFYGAGITVDDIGQFHVIIGTAIFDDLPFLEYIPTRATLEYAKDMFSALWVLHRQEIVNYDFHLGNIAIMDEKLVLFDYERMKYVGLGSSYASSKERRFDSDLIHGIYVVLGLCSAALNHATCGEATKDVVLQEFKEIGSQYLNALTNPETFSAFLVKWKGFFDGPAQKILSPAGCELFANALIYPMSAQDIVEALSHIDTL